MSDRPTPETDSFAIKFKTTCGEKYWIPVDIARKLERERDEAREAIPAGEWIAYEDHQKVHEAASRLLVAINKQLPIGCFTLVSSEYYRLQNAIYGREGAK
jgi:hypothetical protein